MSQKTFSCPYCHSPRRTRQHRKTLADKAWSAFGVFPYRCLECEKSYRSRRSEKRAISQGMPSGAGVHCPRCLSNNLQRIAGRSVTPRWYNFLWRKLGIPGYRCHECRMRFHSLRKLKRG